MSDQLPHEKRQSLQLRFIAGLYFRAPMRKALLSSVRCVPRLVDEVLNSRLAWEVRSVSNAATAVEQAFVFDIDGVLRKGKRTLPQAQEALQKLYTDDGIRPKFPLCFLTNGGGMTEATKAKQLTNWLGVNVASDQVVLAHTPMRCLVPRLADSPVLLSGRGMVKSVAKEYGFKRTVTTEELGRAMPTATPFSSYTATDAVDGICPVAGDGLGTESNPFKAVLVFTDPSDWARDLQLIVDVVMSGGVPGRVKLPPGSAPVEVFFSHADLLWANDFPAPRFGQGAFSLAFESLYKATTGKPAQVTCFGKPTPSPYRLVEKLLMKQLPSHLQQKSTQTPPFSKIYMVGDNPAADVRGARNAKHPWVSVLVKTGVFSKDDSNSKEDPADIVADDVLEFVKSVV